MMRDLAYIFLTAACLASFDQSLEAQAGTRRLSAPDIQPFSAVVMISYFDEIKSSIELSIIADDADGGTSTLELDLERSGAMTFVGGDDLCVAGQVVNTGRIILIKKVADSSPADIYAVIDSVDIPNSDILGITFSPELGKMYLLDATNKKILVGDFALGATSLPATWGVLLDENDTVALESPLHYLLTADASSGLLNLLFEPLGDWVTASEEQSAGQPAIPGFDSYTVQVFAPGIALTITHKGDWRRGSFLNDPQLGDTVVPVLGPGNTNLHLMEMTETTTIDIGSTVTNSEGFGTIILPVDTEIDLGKVYGIKSDAFGSTTIPYVAPVVRVGATEALDQGRVIRRMEPLSAFSHYPGNLTFLMPLHIDHTTPESEIVPSEYTALLAVGTAADISSFQGRMFLNVPSLLQTTAQVWSANEPGFAMLELADLDPSLVGTVIYYQWAVLAPDVRLSDIIGIVVRSQQWIGPAVESGGGGAEGGSGASAASVSSPSTAPEPEIRRDLDASALKTLRDWKKASGFKPSSLLTDLKKKG